MADDPYKIPWTNGDAPKWLKIAFFLVSNLGLTNTIMLGFTGVFLGMLMGFIQSPMVSNLELNKEQLKLLNQHNVTSATYQKAMISETRHQNRIMERICKNTAPTEIQKTACERVVAKPSFDEFAE